MEFEGTVLTFSKFDTRVEELSSGLAQSGVRAGDRVAYWGPNHLALLETLFATTVKPLGVV